jgi:hypothetical protein
MSISIPPDLAAALNDYAAIYSETYGTTEKPETLIGAMLEAFLVSDTGFKRARRTLHNNRATGE